MSAFMVSADCMNRVVNAVMARFNAQGPAYSFRTFAGVDLFHRTADTEIAAALYAMNRAALVARYPDTHSDGGYSDIPEYRFSWVRHDSKIMRFVSAYKATECLLYQCCEGDIDKTPLYQELLAFKHWLAGEIIDMLPEYEKANWG